MLLQRHNTNIKRSSRAIAFWESILRMDLSNKMACFSVTDVVCIQQADGQYAQFVDLAGSRRLGCVVHLSELERADCLRLVPRGHRGAATSWAIRFPAPYAVLLANKRWASVMIPDVRGVRADGGGEIRAMTIPWGELGVARPAVLRRMWQGGVASLDGSALQDVADFLRKRLPEGGDERLQVERLIVAAQAVADDAHADGLKRRIILSSPTANVINRRYRHDFVVKSFIIGCCVKSVARMPDIVREITHMLLGDASAHMLHDVIETLADLQVSKSLISRNRFAVRRHDGGLHAAAVCSPA